MSTGRSDAAIHKEVAAGDKCAIPPHRQSADTLSHDAQRVASSGNLVSVERIRHPARLRCDHDARTATSNDAAELFKHQRGSIRVNFQNSCLEVWPIASESEVPAPLAKAQNGMEGAYVCLLELAETLDRN